MTQAVDEIWTPEISGQNPDITKELMVARNDSYNYINLFLKEVTVDPVNVETHFEIPIVNPDNGDTLPCTLVGIVDLSKHRLSELHAHFSKDLADHKSRVEQLHNRVKAAKLSIQLPKEAELNPQFRDKLREAAASLPDAIEAFNMALNTLAADVQRKIDAPSVPRSPQPYRKVFPRPLPILSRPLTGLSKTTTRSHPISGEAKQDAIKRVKLHYVQEFFEEQAKIGHKAKVDRLKAKQERLDRFAMVVQQEADKLRAIISQAQLGREEINQRLTSMMGSEAVQIKVVSDAGQERFQLVRKSGTPATNLSAGEKTAIAFSYFLTKLKELKPEQFKETIVYIDDPISSLDANHIFQVTAAIRDLFFYQKQKNGWTTTCKQIFISTHNFEFFHLLREVKPDGKNQAHLYLIKRIGSQTSTFGNMPDSLARYASEYHFLFEVIYRFHNAPDKTNHEVLMLLPNAVRRFVELYTYSRLTTFVTCAMKRLHPMIFTWRARSWISSESFAI